MKDTIKTIESNFIRMKKANSKDLVMQNKQKMFRLLNLFSTQNFQVMTIIFQHNPDHRLL